MASAPSPLYLHGDVTARLENGAVAVEDRTIPLDLIEQIIVFSPARVTTPLLPALIGAGISVSWIDRTGRLSARAASPPSGGLERLLTQVDAARDADRSLELAKAFVYGRLTTGAHSMARAARDGRLDPSVAFLLRQAAATALVAEDIDGLRGLEAAGAETYWSWFGALVLNSGFPWKGRTRRPPGDPLNALLSFLSVLWTIRCEGALAAHGLDPRLGFLHVIRPGRASLACDLVEEFRALGPERESLALVNLRQVHAKHFDFGEDGSVLLNHEGRKVVLAAHHHRLAETIKHPDRSLPLPIAALPAVQAERLAHAVVSGSEYKPWLGT